MSENQTNTAAVVLPTLEVSRNDTVVKYVSATKKRGASPGEVFYAPDPVITLDIAIKHIGADDVLSMIMSRWNLQAQRWMAEASLDEAGAAKPFDAEEFKGYAAGFSARGMTIGTLNEEISKLTDSLTDYIQSLEFLTLGTKEERQAAVEPKVNRIKELKAAVAARKNKQDKPADE